MVGDENPDSFYEVFDIVATAAFIGLRCFERVALQFPDEMLKYSVPVTEALKKEFVKHDPRDHPVQLFVMADTSYGSCCADELTAMHVDAQCIVHYGHACLSLTSRLPVWFVFGRSAIDVQDCQRQIMDYASLSNRPLLVLFGLEYAHSLSSIQDKTIALNHEDREIIFADVPCQQMEPSSTSRDQSGVSCLKCNVGGLQWVLPEGRRMEDYAIVWIGEDGSAFTNLLLVYNSCTVVRYDPLEKKLLTDVMGMSKVLNRRYYLVEHAKDATIVGIVVGTLGVAGYNEVIIKIRKMIKSAGKKAYTLVMGKPTPSKLANFPECDVFVLVSCPQTALLNSKEFLTPLITPFEAELAFIDGRQWTGAYSFELSTQLVDPCIKKHIHSTMEDTEDNISSEPRFSLLKGTYINRDNSSSSYSENHSRALAIAHGTKPSLGLASSTSLITTDRTSLDIKSSAEYLAQRTYQGLEITKDLTHDNDAEKLVAVVGRKGRASRYTDEACRN